MTQISNNLFLSGIDSANDIVQLKSNRILHILNLIGDLQPKPKFKELNNLILFVRDSASENIQGVMLECFDFIHKALSKNQAVLVHCQQGISRSATIIIAYLMLANDLTYLEAFAHVRFKRPIVSPNLGFIF